MIHFRRMLPVAALLMIAPFLSAQVMSPQPATSKTVVTKSATSSPGKGTPLDINTASPDQLKALPGIGDAYSKRIIDGRPYTAKNQLITRGILPKGTYEGIADQIIAKRVAK